MSLPALCEGGRQGARASSPQVSSSDLLSEAAATLWVGLHNAPELMKKVPQRHTLTLDALTLITDITTTATVLSLLGLQHSGLFWGLRELLPGGQLRLSAPLHGKCW